MNKQIITDIGKADNIASVAKKASKKGLPPVHLWNPPFCGNLDMRIAKDGTWYYLGTPIGRKPLVKLFSSIIRKDGDSYFLVTPVEKVGITVENAPFLAVDFSVEQPGTEQRVTFISNVDDEATAGKGNPIRVEKDPKTGEVSPYILMRSNLEALIDRKSFYRLVDIGSNELVNGERWFGVWSAGIFFPFILTSEMEG